MNNVLIHVIGFWVWNFLHLIGNVSREIKKELVATNRLKKLAAFADSAIRMFVLCVIYTNPITDPFLMLDK